MGTTEQVKALDFVGTIKPWLRLLYDQIVIVSIVSLFGTLLLFPVFTIGPVILAAIVTLHRSIEQQGGEKSLNDRELARMFVRSILTYFRRGLLFSVLIILSLLVLGVYLLLAFESDAAVFWVGVAFGFYTLLAVILLTFRAGHMLARSDGELTTVDAIVEGVVVARRAPGYSGMHYLFAGFVIMILTALPIFGMVLLLGAVSLLEIAVYESIQNEGVDPLLE